MRWNMFENLKDNATLQQIFSRDTLGHVLESLVYLVIGFFVIRLILFIVRRFTRKRVSRQSSMVVDKLITYTGMTIVLIIVLSELGVNLAALLGAAGVMGLAIGVASQKSLGNMVSGLFLLSEKSFEVGDVVRVGDKTGIVQDVDFLSMKIRTFDNQLVRIPNETLITTIVTNITRYPLRRMDFEFSLSYGDDLQKAEELLIALAQNNTLVLDEPEPFFLLKEYGDNGLGMVFGIWFLKEDYVAVRNSVFREILKNLGDAGLTIPFPQVTLHQSPGSGELSDDPRE